MTDEGGLAIANRHHQGEEAVILAITATTPHRPVDYLTVTEHGQKLECACIMISVGLSEARRRHTPRSRSSRPMPDQGERFAHLSWWASLLV